MPVPRGFSSEFPWGLPLHEAQNLTPEQAAQMQMLAQHHQMQQQQQMQVNHQQFSSSQTSVTKVETVTNKVTTQEVQHITQSNNIASVTKDSKGHGDHIIYEEVEGEEHDGETEDYMKHINNE